MLNLRSGSELLPKSKPTFVAYLYPGWHADPYRPGINEWDLIQNFHPYFKDHKRPPRPINGPYDDSDPATIENQLTLAYNSGINVFLFFTYFGLDGFVMSLPMETSIDISYRLDSNIEIAGSWCVRLPHDQFPVPARDILEITEKVQFMQSKSIKDKLIELSTIEDLEQLLGAEDDIWNVFTFSEKVTHTRQQGLRRKRA
jgi:Glycosyltransferase WbsX